MTSPQASVTLFESVVNVFPVAPPARPQELVDFDVLPRLRRVELSDKFYKQDHIVEYLDTKWKVDLHNRDSILWLLEYRDNHEPTPEQKATIETKLNSFLEILGDQKQVYIALKLNLNKLGLHRKPPEVQQADWNEGDN